MTSPDEVQNDTLPANETSELYVPSFAHIPLIQHVLVRSNIVPFIRNFTEEIDQLELRKLAILTDKMGEKFAPQITAVARITTPATTDNDEEASLTGGQSNSTIVAPYGVNVSSLTARNATSEELFFQVVILGMLSEMCDNARNILIPRCIFG